MKKAVIVFSGGQDSTTILGMAIHQGFECHTISFDYGQKHAIELDQARKIAALLKVPHQVVDMTGFGSLVASKSALLDYKLDVGEQSPLMAAGIPASFVPNRNAMMLTAAHGYAQAIGAASVWTGVCQTDYSGYPDCRLEFVVGLQDLLNRTYQSDITFITPLMFATKAETFRLAEENGVLDLVITESHTCYNGVREKAILDDNQTIYGYRHDWGHGCGECPACQLREKGWNEYQTDKGRG